MFSTKNFRQWAVVLLTLFLGVEADAARQSCPQLVRSRNPLANKINPYLFQVPLDTLDVQRRIEFYRPYSSILMLSDGGKANKAEWIAEHYPLKEINKSDLRLSRALSKHAPSPNYHPVAFDNNERFPFPDNEFDLVMFQKGLCLCSGLKQTCGGIPANKRGMAKFLREVARVLNKNSRQSQAILDGNCGVHANLIEIWSQIAAEFESEGEVQMGIGYFVDETWEGNFLQLVMRPGSDPFPEPEVPALRQPLKLLGPDWEDVTILEKAKSDRAHNFVVDLQSIPTIRGFNAKKIRLQPPVAMGLFQALSFWAQDLSYIQAETNWNIAFWVPDQHQDHFALQVSGHVTPSDAEWIATRVVEHPEILPWLYPVASAPTVKRVEIHFSNQVDQATVQVHYMGR